MPTLVGAMLASDDRKLRDPMDEIHSAHWKARETEFLEASRA